MNFSLILKSFKYTIAVRKEKRPPMARLKKLPKNDNNKIQHIITK